MDSSAASRISPLKPLMQHAHPGLSAGHRRQTRLNHRPVGDEATCDLAVPGQKVKMKLQIIRVPYLESGSSKSGALQRARPFVALPSVWKASERSTGRLAVKAKPA